MVMLHQNKYDSENRSFVSFAYFSPTRPFIQNEADEMMPPFYFYFRIQIRFRFFIRQPQERGRDQLRELLLLQLLQVYCKTDFLITLYHMPCIHHFSTVDQTRQVYKVCSSLLIYCLVYVRYRK